MRARSFQVHVALLLIGAALVLWGASLGWLTWVRSDSLTTSSLPGRRTGGDLSAGMRASAYVALAAVPALFALRRPSLRRWFGALVGAAAAVGVTVSTWDALAFRRHPVLHELVGPAGCADQVSGICFGELARPLAGPVLVGLGAGTLLVAGLLAAIGGGAWRTGLGSSYDAPGAPPEPPVTDKGVWDALDRGDDPTT